MIDNKNVYVNGCSFTWGYDSVLGIKLSSEANNYAFGNFLGARTIINDAAPGSSNAGIATRTVDWMENNTRPDIAIFGWSSSNRVLWPNRIADHSDRLGQHILKYHGVHDVDEEDLHLQSAVTILTLDAYLTQMGIETYHFAAFHTIRHPMLDKLRHKWLWPDSSWANEYNMKLYNPIDGSVYHPDLEEHKRLAQDLKEFIDGKN